MGFMDKIMFWKKGDDFSDLGLGKEFDFGAGKSGLGNAPSPPGRGNDLSLGGDDMGLGMETRPEHAATHGMDDSGYGEGAQSYNSGAGGTRNEGGFSAEPMPSFGSRQSFTPPQQQQGFQQTSSTEMQLISAKLDAIKAYLDTINQRLANLESIARGEHEKHW